jgi:hypothetical protein
MPPAPKRQTSANSTSRSWPTVAAELRDALYPSLVSNLYPGGEIDKSFATHSAVHNEESAAAFAAALC